MNRGHLLELWDRPLTLYLGQIEADRRGEHHPLLDQTATGGVDRQLQTFTTNDDRKRQTDLLLRLRGAA